jgi:hypothetical protein
VYPVNTQTFNCDKGTSAQPANPTGEPTADETIRAIQQAGLELNLSAKRVFLEQMEVVVP